MEYVQENIVELFLIVGLVLLAIEILVLGFATFILLFVGLASVITAGLMYADVIEHNINHGFLSTAVLTGILAASLWNKLREMQQHSETKKATSDLIGMSFTLDQPVSPQGKTLYRYSGVEWLLKSDSTIQQGAKVKVVDIEVGIMHIAPADE